MSADSWHTYPLFDHRPSPPRRRPLSKQHVGDGEFEPLPADTFWQRGDLVQIKRFGPHRDCFGRVVRARAKVNRPILYTVEFYGNDDVIEDLRKNELVAIDMSILSPMEIIALSSFGGPIKPRSEG